MNRISSQEVYKFFAKTFNSIFFWKEPNSYLFKTIAK